jgi:hypothetical protein
LTTRIGVAVSIAETTSAIEAWIAFELALGLKARLMMFGSTTDSLNATSTGSTPSLRSKARAPGFTVSRVVSRWSSRSVAAAKS